MTLKTSRKALTYFSLSLALGVTAVACGDSEDSNDDSTPGDGDAGGTGGSTPGDGDGDNPGGAPGDGDGDGPELDPIYAVTTQVYDGTDFTSYIVLTDSMEAGDLSLDEGIEIAGRSLGVGPNEGGVVFSTSGPEITRYDLNAEGQLEKGSTMSLLVAGLTSIGEYQGQFQFVSEEKAYFFDGSTGQIIVWNPKEMTYTKSLSLSSLIFEDELLTFGGAPLRVGDDIVAFPGWRSTDNTKIIPRAATVTVNTETDEVSIVTDDTCGYVRDGILSDDGMIYMATEAFGSAVYHLNSANAPAPCLIRFDPTAGTFDDSFHTDLTTLFDGEVGGTLLIGPDNSAFILTLDDTDYAGPPVARVLASSPVWNWAHLNLSDTPSAELIDSDPDTDGIQPVTTGGSILPVPFGEEIYLPLLEGREATHFHKFGPNGPETEGSSIDGLSFSAVQVQ